MWASSSRGRPVHERGLLFLSRMLRSLLFVRSKQLFRDMSIFVQKFDPIKGLNAWEIQDENYDYHLEVARSAFADMLHDHERNEKYYVALKSAIEKTHREGKKANVLDIGTGTGLLSMMAAKCGADTITACEAFRPMADCAVKIIEENGFASRIKLVRKRSTEMSVGENGDMAARANILVTEVFDTELIGEGALATFQHAQQVLLEENSLVVPSSGTVWAQLIESPHVRAWNKINPLCDPDTGEVLIVPPEKATNCPGSTAVHDIQLSQLPRDSFKPLLPPQPMFVFDWTGKVPLIFDNRSFLRDTAIATGTAHAVFMWWDLVMDHEEKVLLSCAPVWEHPIAKDLMKNGASLTAASEKIPWRDHWMQAVYYLPEDLPIQKGNDVTLVGSHDEYSFYFHAVTDTTSSTELITKISRPVCDCYLHLAYSRTRIGELNDKKRNDKYLQALKKKINPETICLCISDGSLLGLVAAKLGAKKVIVFEPNDLSRRALATFVASNSLETRVSLVSNLDDLPIDEKPNLVIGDPYYVTSILPWHNLRFWCLATRYAPGIARIPSAAKIRAVPVHFKDLHKIRAPLGICEGFDLTTFDKLIEASRTITENFVEPQPLWEYPSIANSSSIDLAHFDLTADRSKDLLTDLTSSYAPFDDTDSSNGLAIWIDWYLDDETIISTGPTEDIVPGHRISWDVYTRQGVILPPKMSNIHLDKVLQDELRSLRECELTIEN